MADVNLTSEEADALDVVLDPKNWETLHSGSVDKGIEKAAGITDALIKDQKALGSKIVGYRKFVGLSNDPIMITEPGFLVLSDSKLSGDNVVEVTVLPGVSVLQLPGAYILGRGHKLLITPKSGDKSPGLEGLVEPGPLTASVQVSRARMFLNSGALDPVQEFYNHAHGRGGKFTSGGGGGGSAGGNGSGGSSSATVDHARGKEIAKKVAIAAAVVIAVTGLVILGVQHNNNVNSPEGQARVDKANNDKASRFAEAHKAANAGPGIDTTKVRNALTRAGAERENAKNAAEFETAKTKLVAHIEEMSHYEGTADVSSGYLQKMGDWFQGSINPKLRAMREIETNGGDAEVYSSYHKSIQGDAKTLRDAIDTQTPTLKTYSDKVGSISHAMDADIRPLKREDKVQFLGMVSPGIKAHREKADKLLKDTSQVRKDMDAIITPPRKIDWGKVTDAAIAIGSIANIISGGRNENSAELGDAARRRAAERAAKG